VVNGPNIFQMLRVLLVFVVQFSMCVGLRDFKYSAGVATCFGLAQRRHCMTLDLADYAGSHAQ